MSSSAIIGDMNSDRLEGNNVDFQMETCDADSGEILKLYPYVVYSSLSMPRTCLQDNRNDREAEVYINYRSAKQPDMLLLSC